MFSPCLCGFFLGTPGFLPQSKDVHARLAGDSKLVVANEHQWLSVFVHHMTKVMSDPLVQVELLCCFGWLCTRLNTSVKLSWF